MDMSNISEQEIAYVELDASVFVAENYSVDANVITPFAVKQNSDFNIDATLDKAQIEVKYEEYRQIRIDEICDEVADINQSFLQKYNIRDCFRSRRRLKGRIRQADCSEEVRAGGDIPSDGRVLLIQRPLARNKGNDTSGAHLVKCFGEKIIVNEEVVPVITLILHLELPERDIADCGIEETVRVRGVFKSRNRDILPLIQLLCDTTGDAVKLHTVKAGFTHALRHKSHKVSDAAGRFQNVAAGKAHIFKCFVNRLDDAGRRIKSRQSGFSGGGILGRG